MIAQLYNDSVELLKQLIATSSFSKEEDGTAVIIEQFFAGRNIPTQRLKNNVWAVNKYFDAAKPTILLNSHHDTVKPNPQYTRDPFQPVIEDGRLYGLGSNDAGGALVSLIAAFIHFYDKPDLKYNLIIAATAEEEISGTNGIELILPELGKIDVAIVGEPTLMDLAVSEKGLLVLDCIVYGKAGHAAREEGENAIYKALADIEWFRTYQFPKISPTLGPVKMNVTVVNTENKAHNVIPALFSFVVDIRVNDEYSHEDILYEVTRNVQSEVIARSLRMRSTSIAIDHPIVQSGIAAGGKIYGSPTCSDKALMPFPALKCGPGDSARSHTADEFIYLKEIEEGIVTYIEMLSKVMQYKSATQGC